MSGGFGSRFSRGDDDSRGGFNRSGGGYQGRDRDRSDRNNDSFSFGGLGGSLQPSVLGFVAKQEMPMHLSILFRAR